MKKLWILITSFFVICLILISYFAIYPLWGRRLIYPADSQASRYPGTGHITSYFHVKLFASPKGEGRPIFDTMENIGVYTPDVYDVIVIPAQDQLMYTVGTFEKWENIEGSTDKYIVITNPATNKLEMHRVATEYSDLFKETITSYSVESISLDKNKVNKIAAAKSIPEFKNGDVVILVPVIEPPELNKMDDVGNYLTSWIIVRRVGDKL